MRILLISNMYPSNSDPLFGVFVKKTVVSLENHGVQFIRKIVIKGKRSSKLKKLISYASYYYKALLALKYNGEDIIYIHFLTQNVPIIYLYSKLKRAKIVVNLHGSDIHKIKPGSLVDQLQRRTLKRVDQIIVPSLYFQKIVESRYSIIGTKFHIYPSGGIDVNLFQPKTTKPHKDFILSYVSRIDEGKGWETFLETISILNEKGIKTKGIMAGDGNQKDEMLKKIEGNKHKHLINFRGFQSNKELVRIYQESDAFVFPTKLPESLGLVGIEAMSCGAVVFARNIGGPSRYIINGENGFLFSKEDDRDLCRKLEEYFKTNISEQNRIKKRAVKTAANFDSEKVASDLYTNFKRLCTN